MDIIKNPIWDTVGELNIFVVYQYTVVSFMCLYMYMY